MKTIAPDHSYIDYWQWRGYCCAGVRVWPDHCRALASDPGQGPEGLMEYGEVHAIPIGPNLRPRRIGTLTDDLPVEREIIGHMLGSPASDLLALLAGDKSFQEALRPERISSPPGGNPQPPVGNIR